jgi:RNA polymerase subunit RPABC4/transcription elongation factor Spt4
MIEELLAGILEKVLPVLTIVGTILAIYAGVFRLGLTVWTYVDIRSRSESLLVQLFSTLLILLTGLPGFLVFYLLRPHEKISDADARTLEREYILQDFEQRPVCPTCQRGSEPDFLLCPYCHTPLKKKCSACGRLMDLTWQMCPYCGQ